jgi:hypothetical protein
MTNINKLREKMSATVAALESKSISAEEAMAISRAAAVVIGSLRVELQYRQMRAEKPEIAFMDSHNAEPCGGNPSASASGSHSTL